jgi:excisionase family DNA binding protein
MNSGSSSTSDDTVGFAVTEPIVWLSTKEAAERLGITLRSLYRFIDEGDLVAYKFGRVIRIQQEDVDRFIAASRIVPGSLEHLYPEVKGTNGRPAAAMHEVPASEAG